MAEFSTRVGTFVGCEFLKGNVFTFIYRVVSQRFLPLHPVYCRNSCTHTTVCEFGVWRRADQFMLISKKSIRAIAKVKGHQHWWLAGGYDLEIRHY